MVQQTDSGVRALQFVSFLVSVKMIDVKHSKLIQLVEAESWNICMPLIVILNLVFAACFIRCCFKNKRFSLVEVKKL